MRVKGAEAEYNKRKLDGTWKIRGGTMTEVHSKTTIWKIGNIAQVWRWQAELVKRTRHLSL